jgi:hypothetical protein
MGMLQDPPLGRAEFWMRIAAWAFGLWSLMIPVGVMMLKASFDKSSASISKLADEHGAFVNRFEAYVLNMERRVTIIEERQSRVLKALEDMDGRMDRVETGQRRMP